MSRRPVWPARVEVAGTALSTFKVYVPLGSGAPLSLSVRTTSHLLSGMSVLGFELKWCSRRIAPSRRLRSGRNALRDGAGDQVARVVVDLVVVRVVHAVGVDGRVVANIGSSKVKTK